MSRTIQMDIDEDVLQGLRKSPEELAREMRLAAATKWYEMGVLSQEKAAQVAGLTRAAFISALTTFGVSALQETAEEILPGSDRGDRGRPR